MPEQCVVDTVILQKANGLLTKAPGAASLFKRRLALLQRFQRGELIALKSATLIAEYRRQIKAPRNDFIRAFFSLIDHPTRSVENWKSPWSGPNRDAAGKCRFPREDTHVLRTAIRDSSSSTIFSEEARLVAADACIYRAFGVHLRDLP